MNPQVWIWEALNGVWYSDTPLILWKASNTWLLDETIHFCEWTLKKSIIYENRPRSQIDDVIFKLKKRQDDVILSQEKRRI